jgi:hypothetical protein
MVLWIDAALDVRPNAVIIPRLVSKVKRVHDVLGFLFQALQLSIGTGVVRRDT